MEIPALGEQGKSIDLREMDTWVHGCGFGQKFGLSYSNHFWRLFRIGASASSLGPEFI